MIIFIGKSIMNEIIGWIAASLLTLSGLPMLIKTYKLKSVAEMSFTFLLMWFLGCVLFLIHLTNKNGEISIPIFTNYVISGIISLNMLVLFFKYRNN